MGFASAWLDQRALYPQFIKEPPLKETGIIVAVPAYNEPGIPVMLDSLAAAIRPSCGVEVIVVVNAPPSAPKDHILNNQLTVSLIKKWKEVNKDCFFSLFFIEPEPYVPGWGVGLARKTGMDEALRRFNSLDNSEGIIVCLDADCTVSSNYFRAIEEGFASGKNRRACSIYFEHRFDAGNLRDTAVKAITLYELHLRYYYQALKYSGYPYVFHTVGSAMAVRALPYMKCGGMNRKQAGEDFYFIQKLLPSGGYFSINAATVFPMARPSFRVPFGTGATMEKLLKETDPAYFTYDLRAFTELKHTFASLALFYRKITEGRHSYNQLPPGLKTFVKEDEWQDKMNELMNNTSGYESFRKRFFDWFNMFKIVKYLNSVHQGYFSKKKVGECASLLLDELAVNAGSRNVSDLLDAYRVLEKN